MDALKPFWALNSALFAQRPWTLIFSLLMTAAVVVVAVTGDGALRSTSEFLAAVALWCWLGRASLRLPAIACWAGELGIPRHHETLRSVQIALLIVSLSLSFLMEMQFALDLRAWLASMIISAMVLPMATSPQLYMGMLLAMFVARMIDPRILSWPMQPAVAAIFVCLCVVLLVQWFRVIRQLEKRAAVASHRLSDAAHEAAHPEDFDRAQFSLDTSFGSSVDSEPAGRVSPRRFWLGMGYDSQSSWRVTGYSLLFAILALAAAHFSLSGQRDALAYVVLSAGVVLAAFGRFNGMHEAWMRTPHEQSILLLSPLWPQGARLKIQFLRALSGGLAGYCAYWIGLSAFAVVLGIEWRTILMVGAGLLIAMMSICLFMMHYVSRRRASPTSTFAITHAILVLLGLGSLMGGWGNASPRWVLIGLALIFLPGLPTTYLFCTRRMQFPVQPPPGPPA